MYLFIVYICHFGIIINISVLIFRFISWRKFETRVGSTTYNTEVWLNATNKRRTKSTFISSIKPSSFRDLSKIYSTFYQRNEKWKLGKILYKYKPVASFFQGFNITFLIDIFIHFHTLLKLFSSFLQISIFKKETYKKIVHLKRRFAELKKEVKNVWIMY